MIVLLKKAEHMSKQKFLGNSLLIFVGVNIANLASYILYILLLKYDKALFNDYIPISSIVGVLFTVSLIIFRAFAVNGEVIYKDLWDKVTGNKLRTAQISVGILILSFVISFLLTLVQDRYSFLALLLTIFTALASYIYSMYRGIRQYDGDLINMIIGINIETFGRLLIGFALGYFLGFGIEGILFSMVVAHVVGIFYMYKRPVSTIENVNKIDNKLARTFINSFIFTLGLELFINILILFANTRLESNEEILLNFNSLEFFRKTVMLSIVAISGYIISTSAKKTYSKKFTFLFTLITGTVVAGSVIGLFYLFKTQLSVFINLDLNRIDSGLVNLFFIGTLFSALAYLISNWLFSFQRNIYIYLPIVLSGVLAILLGFLGIDFAGIIKVFTGVSTIFLVAYLGLSLWEVSKKEEEIVDSLIDEISPV